VVLHLERPQDLIPEPDRVDHQHPDIIAEVAYPVVIPRIPHDHRLPALDGLLDSPHFTRPELWQGPQGPLGVPPVLLGGHHERIERYRREQRLALTARQRPDLIARARAEGRLAAQDERFLRSLG